MTDNCPFCECESANVIFDSDLVFAIYDAYPVTQGHCLIIPKRHYSSWFESSHIEQLALMDALAQCQLMIEKEYSPDGWNIGVNVGRSAGQTINHLHIHLIPRYLGDVDDPTGGVRAVIPGQANYLASKNLSEPPKRLITGDADQFLPHFKAELEKANIIEFASAFIMRSGVDLIWDSLLDFVGRGGHARIVTGDYLNFTDPIALNRLLDLGEQVDLRVYETAGQSFHPKAYLFYDADSTVSAFVGSSNLSKSALTNGVEWNYKILSKNDVQTQELVDSFALLFNHPKTTKVTDDWIDAYHSRRGDPGTIEPIVVDLDSDHKVPQPHKIQTQALLKLQESREDGNRAGLVVLATGLGKTWLSAFDSNASEFQKILFVAHREEILNQSLATFRNLRPRAKLGKYTGTKKDKNADILFASIQTLGRVKHHSSFERDEFDYIVIDEFHHAAAASYRKLIDYFSPKFLLGLTATPERTDGANLLAICQDNLVFENDMIKGIEEGLLCRFKYYGVPDDVDYESIPWRSRRFDEEKLTEAVATKKRADNALEQFRAKGGTRALGFCCSIRHADFMARHFTDNGLRAVAVHSDSSSYPRARAIEELSNGELDIIFAVDVFNEGLDVPSIDTVLMLRPTQSSIIWLQQFGRGLRKSDGKSHLNVIDYIGNHRSFLVKIKSMLMPIAGGIRSDAEIALALRKLDANELTLPEGCEVIYDLEVKNIISHLLRKRDSDDAIDVFYRDFVARNGMRPTAGDVFRAGYNPRALRRSFGSWLGFVLSMKGLTENEESIYLTMRAFFDSLDSTQMSKSYKMLLLMALLNCDAIPGQIGIGELTTEYQRIAQRRRDLANDVGKPLESLSALQKSLETNPIAAWVGGKGTDDVSYFSYVDSELKFLPTVDAERREAFQSLLREVVDWRLTEYLARASEASTRSFTAKIIHSRGTPIIKLPDRTKNESIPTDWIHVVADGRQYSAKFAKEFVNVIRKNSEDGKNVLPELLRGWFGMDVGQPGTNFHVRFEHSGDSYILTPQITESAAFKAIYWQHYKRELIPEYFGEEFKQMVWQQGFVPRDGQIFLFVTLDKSNHEQQHQYQDYFESPNVFHWQSQNRTKQSSKHGQLILNHGDLNVDIRLFIRKQPKLNGKAAPFIYCGEVDFIDWEGEQPISVRWQLREPVPPSLYETLAVPT